MTKCPLRIWNYRRKPANKFKYSNDPNHATILERSLRNGYPYQNPVKWLNREIGIANLKSPLSKAVVPEAGRAEAGIGKKCVQISMIRGRRPQLQGGTYFFVSA